MVKSVYIFVWCKVMYIYILKELRLFLKFLIYIFVFDLKYVCIVVLDFFKRNWLICDIIKNFRILVK